MRKLVILLIILLLVITITNKENFKSSLDIYYPHEKDKQKYGLCGECDGYCKK